MSGGDDSSTLSCPSCQSSSPFTFEGIISQVRDQIAFISCSALDLSTLFHRNDTSVLSAKQNARLYVGCRVVFNVFRGITSSNARRQTMHVASRVAIAPMQGQMVYQGEVLSFLGGFGFIQSLGLPFVVYFEHRQVRHIHGCQNVRQRAQVTFAISGGAVLNHRGDPTHRAKWVRVQ